MTERYKFKIRRGGDYVRYIVFEIDTREVRGGSGDIAFSFSTYRDLSFGLLNFSKDDGYTYYDKYQVYDTFKSENIYETDNYEDSNSPSYQYDSPRERLLSFLDGLADRLED